MSGRRRLSVSCMFLTGLVAVLLMPDLSSAGPIGTKTKREGVSLQQSAALQASSRQLVRNRRNISWYKQHADFWSWYKYFTDNGNQEAVQDLDRIYLSYLQKKNRAEGRRSYRAYLSHLGEVYKSCSDSEDPECVAVQTARPTPEPPKPAPLKTCDPTRDAHCLYAALLQGKSPYLPLVLPPPPPTPPPAGPAPVYARGPAPAKQPRSGYYYYSPSVQPFLTKEQKAELLRICSAEDVECLQYHLKAAFGYKPAAGPPPSYAHLGCDPRTDPACRPQLVQKTPAGRYLKYPDCDPLRDPGCAASAALSAPRAPRPPAPPGPGSCNPLTEEGCNPLTATRFSRPEVQQEEQEEEAASAALRAPAPPPEDHPYAAYRQAPPPENHPYAAFRDAFARGNRAPAPYAAYRQTPPQENDPYAAYRQTPPQENDPYAAYRQTPPQENDPYAAYRQTPPQENDPYAAYRQTPPQENDPYAAYRQTPPQENDPYAAYRQTPPQENDPYAAYLQPRAAAAPPTSDPYAALRRLMSEARSSDPRAPRPGAAAAAAAPEADANDPLAALRQAWRRAQGRHGDQQSAYEPQQHPLGPPGKTKEGYDCYIGYDRECYALKAAGPGPRPQPYEPRPHPAQPYEPHLNADGSRDGVVEPSNPDCDPEYDPDCRLRRSQPRQEEEEEEAQHPEEEGHRQGAAESEPEPYQSGQEEPYMAYPQQGPQSPPSFQDILRAYGDQRAEGRDHRAYEDHYPQK